jgi:methionyl-tRNA formyltransferase
MLMDPGLDTGPVLLQKEVEILPDDNEGALEARLAEVGADLLIETLELLEKRAITPRPQDDSLATHAPSVKKEDCRIDWNQDSQTIVNRIRGCTPRPGAYAAFKDSLLKIWSGEAIGGGSGSPGQVIEVGREGIRVKAGRGSVLLTEVQPENRNRMKAGDFARGYGITAGTRLS